MKSLTIIFLLLFFSMSSNSQNFVNGDLNGPPVTGVSILPFGWSAVPYTDINCLASGSGMASPDLTDQFGPGGPVSGIPYSGITFVTGALSRNNAANEWHEGIEQTVSGFCIGCQYSVNFFQTIVRKAAATDPSGCWSVFIDN